MRTPYMYTCSPSMGINKTKTAYNTRIYSDTVIICIHVWLLFHSGTKHRSSGATHGRPGLRGRSASRRSSPSPVWSYGLERQGRPDGRHQGTKGSRHPPPPATWALNQNRPARSCRLLGGICEEGSLPPTVSGVPRTDRRRLAATHRHRRACPRFRSASGFFRPAPSSPRPDGSHSPIQSRCRA